MISTNIQTDKLAKVSEILRINIFNLNIKYFWQRHDWKKVLTTMVFPKAFCEDDIMHCLKEKVILCTEIPNSHFYK